ncbi:MAG: hypothetical protein KME43_18095 [Myxacorys chilensis ATA2-1-KO14]|jgi:hypothetical protein|nr:hypothetical protein [Myxacorys chilensis ATA2-1-KO14]
MKNARESLSGQLAECSTQLNGVLKIAKPSLSWFSDRAPQKSRTDRQKAQ